MKKYSIMRVLLVTALLVFMLSFAAAEGNRNITVENNNCTIYVGKPQTITASVENTGEDAPAKTVLVWKSSDESIVKVDNRGKVTGISAGKAEVTVSAQDDETICASIGVEVRIPVKTLTIEPKKAELYIGGTEEQAKTALNCTIAPEDASDRQAVWSSSDEKIATVDQNGVVTAVAKGSTVITATDLTGTKKATCKVTVAQAVTGIEMEKEEYTVPAPKTVQIKATVSPADAYNKKLVWSSSDEKIATVSDRGVVKGVTEGEVTVMAASADGGNVAASCKVKVVMPVGKITVNEGNKIILPKGEHQRVNALVEPKDATVKDIIWSSSNEQVATVDQTGMVTGVSYGTTRITAAAMDGSNVKGEVNISVETFDYVFRSMDSQSLELSTTFFGGDNIRVSTQNGTVDVTVSGVSMMVGAGGAYNGTTFSIRPIKVGSDVITFKYGPSKIRKTVYVAPEAFGMASDSMDKPEVNPAAANDTGSGDDLLFLGVPWRATYQEAKALLTSEGKELKPPVRSNSSLRAMVDNDIVFADVSAFKAAMNFSYDPEEENVEENNMFCKGDFYFDNIFSFDEVLQAVVSVYGLEEGEPSGESWSWQKNDVRLVLTQKQKFIILEMSIGDSAAEPGVS